MKISASVYSNKSKPLEELVKELDGVGVDFFHIDCNDDPSVFPDIERIHAISRTPADLHIISPSPEKYFDALVRVQPAQVCFQLEDLHEHLHFPEGYKGRKGIAIVSETPIEALDPYLDAIDFVLFMTTTPGKSGGTFNKENFRKIRQFKMRHPGMRIHVDGGVNDQVAFVLRNMGVSLVVSGSFLVNADYVGLALHNLRHTETGSPIRVGDFMIGKEESPVIRAPFTFRDVLQSIEDWGMGFTMVEGASGKLEGLISNADVRRGLLKYIDSLDTIDATTLINRKPLLVHDTHSVSELLHIVRSAKFPVLYLPVTDEAGHVAGSLIFNNLIKGEL